MVVEAVVDGEDVVCTVTDSGPGIPKAFLDQLFKKFSQVDASDTRNTSGTGLGLAISRKLVSNMYGTIGYAESPGEGAQFWVRFPRTDISYGSNASGSKAQTT